MTTRDQSAQIILARKLKHYRQRAGMTIYEVGDAIGRSGKTVSAWETGHGQPDAEMFMKLYHLYGVDSMSEFFGITDKPMPVNETELLESFRMLNDEGQRLILATINAYIRSGDYAK